MKMMTAKHKIRAYIAIYYVLVGFMFFCVVIKSVPLLVIMTILSILSILKALRITVEEEYKQ